MPFLSYGQFLYSITIPDAGSLHHKQKSLFKNSILHKIKF